jgi:hypothetical protein
MSPWLLEAEALVNASDDDFGDTVFADKTARQQAATWGFSPTNLPLEIKSTSTSAAGEMELGKLFESGLETIVDNDELDDIAMFVNAPAALSPDAALRAAQPTAKTVQLVNEPSQVTPPGTTPASVAEEARTARRPEYAVGDSVKYWSGTRGIWMPGVVVERRPRGVYMIDKQMKGILGKVKTCDLISEAEERSDRGLRAFAAFEDENGIGTKPSASPIKQPAVEKSSRVPPSPGPGAAPPASFPCEEPRSKRGIAPAANARTGASPVAAAGQMTGGRTTKGTEMRQSPAAINTCSPTSARGVGKPLDYGAAGAARAAVPFPAIPATPPSVKGRIVRDDFSDDSDDGW